DGRWHAILFCCPLMFMLKRVALLILVALLAACDSSAPTTAIPSPLATVSIALPTAAPSATVVQFWTVLPDRGVTEQTLNATIAAFQKEHPDIAIKVSSQPNYTELYRKVVASVAGGALPDLVTGLDADIAAYDRFRALAPLSNYLDDPSIGLSASEKSDIPPAFLESARLAEEGNRIMSLPFARGVMALYYNWSAMKAIGITNTPKTWDEFKLHAGTLTKNPVRGYAFRPDVNVFGAMLLSRGGSPFNADLNKATFNSAAGVDSLQFIGGGLKEGWIYHVESTGDLNDFAIGRAIFNIASTTYIPQYQSAIADAVKKGGKDFEWGVTVLPNTGKPAVLSVGSNIAMLRSANEKQQAAWLFIKWMMRERNAAAWTQSTGVLPTRGAARDYLKDYLAKTPQQAQAMDELLPLAHPDPVVRPAAEIRDLLDGAINAFEQGRTGAKAVLDDAANKATILLNEKQ
ncbi:MAG: extracellular solute-binding protein, partial [Chloroflexi bacterium]|nr:extracellular solute-binding protein [Chloroflexota bacterium]